MRDQRSLEIENRLHAALGLIVIGEYSTPGLAAALQVSIPTISRCVEALDAHGHDIRAVRNAEGWRYLLKPSPMTRWSGRADDSRRESVGVTA
jgi:hypothetical protein